MKVALEKGQVSWTIIYLIKVGNMFLKNMEEVIIQHTYREGNQVADWLENLGVSLNSCVIWKRNLLEELCSLARLKIARSNNDARS